MKLLLTLAGAITALLSSKSVLAEYGLNMTQGITDISKDIYGLHMMVKIYSSMNTMRDGMESLKVNL